MRRRIIGTASSTTPAPTPRPTTSISTARRRNRHPTGGPLPQSRPCRHRQLSWPSLTRPRGVLGLCEGSVAIGESMQIRVGFEMVYRCPQPTPMILALSIHYSRASDLVRPDHLRDRARRCRSPPTATCSATGAAASSRRRAASCSAPMRWSTTAALPDVVAPSARADAGRAAARVDPGLPAGQPLLRDRPAVRHRLAAVRPRADRLGARAGDLRLRAPATSSSATSTRAARAPPGRPTTKACGVCRDYAHLAIALCRCMNIPARYCTGYLGDIRHRRRPTARWTSPAGSRPTSATAGTPSTRATTRRASAAC